MSSGGLFLFRSSPRPRRIFMHKYWRAERRMRLRLTVPTRRLPATARPCGTERDRQHRTTHRFKVSLRRAGRPIGETSATPRTLSCRAGGKHAGVRVGRIMPRMSRPSCGRIRRRSFNARALIDPAHHYRTKGLWFSRQYDARSKL